MSTFLRSAIVALTVVAGVSAAQAEVRYDSGRQLSTYNLNTPEGAQGFWDQVDRNGN